jgi:hypothetical protein
MENNIMEIAPRLFTVVPKRLTKIRTISVALNGNIWISDIKGALMVQVLLEHLKVWDLLNQVKLRGDSCF